MMPKKSYVYMLFLFFTYDVGLASSKYHASGQPASSSSSQHPPTLSKQSSGFSDFSPPPNLDRQNSKSGLTTGPQHSNIPAWKVKADELAQKRKDKAAASAAKRSATVQQEQDEAKVKYDAQVRAERERIIAEREQKEKNRLEALEFKRNEMIPKEIVKSIPTQIGRPLQPPRKKVTPQVDLRYQQWEAMQRRGISY